MFWFVLIPQRNWSSENKNWSACCTGMVRDLSIAIVICCLELSIERPDVYNGSSHSGCNHMMQFRITFTFILTGIGIYWLWLLLSGLATIHTLPLWVRLTKLLKSLVRRSMELTIFQRHFPGLAHHSLKNGFANALEQTACYRGERSRNNQLQQQLLSWD